MPDQFGVGLDGTSGGYWHLPSTVVDRRLSQHNLMRAGEYEGKHLSDAVRYRDNLGGVAGIYLIQPAPAQSKQVVCVPVVADPRQKFLRT